MFLQPSQWVWVVYCVCIFSCKGEKKEEPWWVNFFLLPVLNFFFSLFLFPSFSFYVSMKILLSFSHKDSGGLYHFLILDRLELEKRTLIYLNKCYFSLKLFLVVKIESRIKKELCKSKWLIYLSTSWSLDI